MRTPYVTASLIAGAIATALELEEPHDVVVYFDGVDHNSGHYGHSSSHHGSHSYVRDDHGHGHHGYTSDSSDHYYHHSSSDDYGHNLTSDHHGHGYGRTSYSSHGGHFGGHISSHYTSDGYSLPSTYSLSDHHGGHNYHGGYTSDAHGHLSLTSYSDAIHDSYSDVHYFNPYSELDELEAIVHHNLAPVHYDYGYTHNPY